MSSSVFNQAVRKSIINMATESIKILGAQGTIKDSKYVLDPKSRLSLETIRARTNKAAEGYQSVISRGGLQGLADDFHALQQGKANFAQAAQLLQSPGLYDNFIAHITNLYGGNEYTTSTQSYTYRVLRTDKGKIRLGTSTGGSNEQDIAIFKNLDHGEFKKVFVDFLYGQFSGHKDVVDTIKENLDAGHLAGVFDIKIREIFDLQVAAIQGTYREYTVNAGADQQLNNAFNEILRLIHDADFITSNITYDVTLFTSMIKDVHGPANQAKVSAMMQLSLLNQEAGRALTAMGTRLNQLIGAVDVLGRGRSVDERGAEKAVDGLIDALLPVVKVIEKTANRLLNSNSLDPQLRATITKILTDAQTTKTMVETKGSPSVLESIANEIAAALSGKAKPKRQVTTIKNTEKIKLSVGSKAKSKIPKVTPSSSKKPNIRKISASKNIIVDTAIPNLQSLLNRNLVERVKQNMGTGGRRDILNLRSGRFAESVRVERLSESRGGAITAFYSYMRNPYATFSSGGRQENPRSRDPKLLISKSIRELAQTITQQRLRAVLV